MRDRDRLERETLRRLAYWNERWGRNLHTSLYVSFVRSEGPVIELELGVRAASWVLSPMALAVDGSAQWGRRHADWRVS